MCNKYSVKVINQAVKWYQSNKNRTMESVRDKFGMSTATFSMALKERKISTNHPHCLKKDTQITAAEKAMLPVRKMIAMYKAGATQQAVADAYGISFTCVHKILVDNGVKLRSAAESNRIRREEEAVEAAEAVVADEKVAMVTKAAEAIAAEEKLVVEAKKATTVKAKKSRVQKPKKATAKVRKPKDVTIVKVTERLIAKVVTSGAKKPRRKKQHRKPLTESQRMQIISLYSVCKMSSPVIAKEFGITPGGVTYLVRTRLGEDAVRTCAETCELNKRTVSNQALMTALKRQVLKVCASEEKNAG